MKLINHVNATAASRQTLDDYQPPVNPHPVDMIEAIKARYRFQTFPNTSPGLALPSPTVYTSGVLSASVGQIGINILMMDQAGDIAQAVTTDQADAILDDVASFMDEQFGFSVTASETKRSYVSNLVVEFDEAIEHYIAKLGSIAYLMQGCCAQPGKALTLKRLAFGAPSAAPTDQMGLIEAADFLVERRVDAPAETNRYFCSAPLQSESHVALLQEIEDVLKKG